MLKSISNPRSGSHVSMAQQLLLLGFLLFYGIRFLSPMPTSGWVVNLVCLGLFLCVYFASFRYWRWAVPCTLIMTTLAVVAAPYNYGSATFAIYAASFAGWITSRNWAIALTLFNALALIMAKFLWDLPWLGFAVWSVIMVIVLGFSSVLDAERIHYLEAQQRDRDELKRLAIMAERERIGRDLHDLLGHTLSLIHLKAQLSIKHADAGNIESLQSELEQIRTISSDSLKEVRAAVSGYRNQRLAEELMAHKHYFHNSGIELHWQLPDITLAPAVEGELALVVREALTNVIRHSKATKCEVRMEQPELNRLQLSIQDNGKGGDLNHSNGITGLKQRLQSLGGTLSVCGKDGCLVTATLPWSY